MNSLLQLRYSPIRLIISCNAYALIQTNTSLLVDMHISRVLPELCIRTIVQSHLGALTSGYTSPECVNLHLIPYNILEWKEPSLSLTFTLVFLFFAIYLPFRQFYLSCLCSQSMITSSLMTNLFAFNTTIQNLSWLDQTSLFSFNLRLHSISFIRHYLRFPHQTFRLLYFPLLSFVSCINISSFFSLF